MFVILPLYYQETEYGVLIKPVEFNPWRYLAGSGSTSSIQWTPSPPTSKPPTIAQQILPNTTVAMPAAGIVQQMIRRQERAQRVMAHLQRGYPHFVKTELTPTLHSLSREFVYYLNTNADELLP